MRNLLIIALLGFAVAGNVWAQPAKNKRQAANPAPFFDEADALFGKRQVKRTGTTKAHDKYANQEVSYRQTKNEVSIESLEKSKGTKTRAVVFEPNNEPLWAKQNKRRKQAQKHAKNQDIEVENDETHRTRPRATRTETVNHNETHRTKPRRANVRRRKN